jgi:peptidoglycan biosynthesis protein MviN/MurJ (putative lipid II flippase)
MGVYGLAWAAVIVSIVEAAILFYIMSRRIEGLFDKTFVNAVVRMASAAGFMAIITYMTLSTFPLSADSPEFWSSMPKFGLVIIASGLSYLLFCRLFKLPEATPVINRIVKFFYKPPKVEDESTKHS